MNTDSGYGFKALDPTGATYNNRRDGSTETVYPLPGPGEKWGPWFAHPNPLEPDGAACGPGRFHVWNSLSLEYGPPGAWPWFVQWEGEIGSDYDKTGVRKLRLRRIAPRVLARSLRPPFNWGKEANLSRAYLSEADLPKACLYRVDLSRANLSKACLYRVDLSEANLYRANLSRANLSRANLYRADLSRANLSRANLSRADLRGAVLYRADLRGAVLYRADLSRANLSGADWDRYTIWPAGFSPD